MSGRTNIQWATHVWNPIRGCSRISPGCQNCYAERYAALRLSHAGRQPSPGRAGRKPGAYHGLAAVTSKGPRWTGKVVAVPGALEEPRHWSPKKPRRVFVNSMSDLFHEALPDGTIAAVFQAMADAPAHTFLVLTKRAKRMRDFLNRGEARIEDVPRTWLGAAGAEIPWPLPNVWVGVSVEDQARADERIPLLLAAAASVRFLSVEPLLEEIDLIGAHGGDDWLGDGEWEGTVDGELLEGKPEGIDWVIVGGESGPAARPCDVAWIRSVVRDCRWAKVPVFVKQLGARSTTDEDLADWRNAWPGGSIKDLRGNRACFQDPKGGDPAEWPEDIRVRELPGVARSMKGGA